MQHIILIQRNKFNHKFYVTMNIKKTMQITLTHYELLEIIIPFTVDQHFSMYSSFY